MTEYRIDLPWSKPPLSMNDRRGHYEHARIVKEVRDAIPWLVKQHKLGTHGRIRVELHVQAADRRERDDENPVATLKPICDGLVDAGVVPGDTRRHMVKDMPVIHESVKGERGRLWLVVTALDAIEESA